MAANWPKLVSIDSPEELDRPLPLGWRLDKVEHLYEQLPVGKRFDQKTSSSRGRVPVFDQSEAGVIGWHDEEPGVFASELSPVVTFANHTCEMRLIREPFSVIQNVFPLVGRKGVCETLFLYYGTKGRVWLEEYKGHFPDYRRKWVPVPPILEQRAIAHILGTLDEKIELNRRRNETLEAMAGALFQDWFVDFGPVRAKTEGRDPYLPADLWRLFPESLHDDGMPQGWKEVVASDLIEFNPPESLRKGTLAPYLDMASLPTSGSWPEPPTPRGYGSGMRFRNGDTLLARITPCLENGKTAFVQCLPEDTIGWGSTEYIVMRARAPVPPEYAYLLARSVAFREHAIRSMTGTSGRQRVQGDSVAAFKMASPSDEELWHAFARQTAPVFASVKSNAKASETLSQLRDTLLPKLISGELRIKDAERFMEERAA